MTGSRIARGAARSLVFRFLTAASDALVLLVTARGLGASGRGLYALTSVSAVIMVMVVGGVAIALGGELAHGRARPGQLQATSVVVAVVAGGGLGGAVAIAAALSGPDARFLLYAAAALPFLLLTELQIGLYNAQGRVRALSWVQLSRSAIPLLALSASVAAAPGRAHLALSVWAGAQAIVPLATLRAQGRQERFAWRGLGPLLRRLLRSSLPISLANSIALLNYRVDVLVVAALLPLAEVGRYSAAVAAGEALLLVAAALVTGAYATIGGSRHAESVRVTMRALRHSTGLLVGGGAVLLALAYVGFGPILGDDFAQAWRPLALLLPGIVALGMAWTLIPFFLIHLERSGAYLAMASGATVANLVLAILLVPPLGLEGAALSTSVSYIGGAGYLLWRFAAAGGSRDLRAYVPGRAELRDYRALIASLLPRPARAGH